MPDVCAVQGRFLDRDGQPLPGLIRFTPERLWVVERSITWATLAPWQVLWEDGRFVVELTPTDCDGYPWYYLVDTPAGRFRISVPYREVPYTLRELVDHHSAERPAH